MLKGKWPEQIMQFLLCMLAFLIPFPYICTAICIVVLVAVWLLGANFKETLHNLANRKILWAWIGYFLLHVISYTYSSNKWQSSFDLQTKLSLFILPIVLGAGTRLNRKLIERIFVFFNLGISAIATYCIVHALMRCKAAGYFYKPFFFYNDLTDGLDTSAVYSAWYVMLSIAAMLLIPWQYYYKRGWQALKVALIILQFVFFVLLSARTLLILFFVFLVPFYIYKILKHKKIGVLQTMSIAVVFIGIGVGVMLTDNPVKKRFDDIFQKDLSKAWLKDYHNVPQKDFSNMTLRLMVWRMGFENLNEHHLWLFGAGNGDVQDLQNRKMAAYGIDVYNTDPKKRSEFFNLNLHNMAIQSVMMIGIPGLILFIFIIFAPLLFIRKIALKHFFFVFHITALCFLFQEAALQTQAGVIYYTFFSILFLNIYYTKSDEIRPWREG